MRSIFSKLLSFINYYIYLIEKDPFVKLNIKPLDYMKNKDLKINQETLQYYKKEFEFIQNNGLNYIQDIKKCYLDLPEIYRELLSKEEDIETKYKGFKIADSSIELNSNIMIKGIFLENRQDKIKAAYKYKLATFYYKQFEYKESKKALQEAINYDSNNFYIINNLFILNYLLGEFEELQKIVDLLITLGLNEFIYFSK